MNEYPAAPAPRLRVVLPGVVSWSRPRKARGGVRYPTAYARARDAWALLVARAVVDARWTPPPGARYRVAVATYGGGRRDLDRVCTAVLDALQAGGAVLDDCLVDALTAARGRRARGRPPATVVDVAVCSRSGASPCGPAALPAPDVPRQREPRHAC
jgi:Holliday junction resolvase RusA-like endonuclease